MMKVERFRALFLVLLSSVLMTGCIRELTLDDVKNMQDPTPTNWDEYMRAAQVEIGRGNIDKACERYQQAMDDAEAKFGATDMHIATAASYYAKIQYNRGKFQDAERLYKKALEVEQSTLKATDPDVIETRKALADVLLKLYKEDEAKQMLAGIKTAPAGAQKHKRHHR